MAIHAVRSDSGIVDPNVTYTNNLPDAGTGGQNSIALANGQYFVKGNIWTDPISEETGVIYRLLTVTAQQQRLQPGILISRRPDRLPDYAVATAPTYFGGVYFRTDIPSGNANRNRAQLNLAADPTGSITQDGLAVPTSTPHDFADSVESSIYLCWRYKTHFLAVQMTLSGDTSEPYRVNFPLGGALQRDFNALRAEWFQDSFGGLPSRENQFGRPLDFAIIDNSKRAVDPKNGFYRVASLARATEISRSPLPVVKVYARKSDNTVAEVDAVHARQSDGTVSKVFTRPSVPVFVTALLLTPTERAQGAAGGVRLEWVTQGATSQKLISTANGVTTETALAAGAASHVIRDTPTHDTLYTIQATNAEGSSSTSATFHLYQPIVISLFNERGGSFHSTPTIPVRYSATLEWQVTGYPLRSLVLTDNVGSPARDVLRAGSFGEAQIGHTKTGTATPIIYTLTATGGASGAAPVTRSVTINWPA